MISAYRHIVICTLLFFSVGVSAQQILTIDNVTSISRNVGQLLLDQFGLIAELDTGVDVFRVTYTATGSDMELDTASGLIMLPDVIDGDLPVLVYQHGTVDGRDDVPSNLEGGFQLGLIFAAKNMAVIAPDFLGLGTSRGFHPYVHASTEATAAVDMLDASLAWMEENNIGWNEQLFITGYSQGGHAAMALHQYIEREIPERYTVTASCPMSGPYSLSGVMRELAFTDEPYSFPSYFAYTVRALREINPSLYMDESELFEDAYLPDIREFIDSGNGLFALNQRLVSTLISETGAAIPRGLFRDSILNILENEDDHPIVQALAESDVYDWTPSAPVLMLYCPTDNQVPFANAIIADSVMNARGAEQVMSMDVSDGRFFDHTDCVIPALNVAIPWILGFVDTTTPVPNVPITTLSVFPNPASDMFYILHPDGVERIRIYSLGGQLIRSLDYQGDRTIELDIQDLEQGLYLIGIESESTQELVKMVVE